MKGDDMKENILLEEFRLGVEAVYIRRARENSTTITVCPDCWALLDEQPTKEEEGRLVTAQCTQCADATVVH